MGRRPRRAHAHASSNESSGDKIDSKSKMFEALKGRDFSNVPLGTFRPTRVDEAKAQIARFLGARMRTKRELFEKLTRDKGYEEEDAIEALRAMEAAGAVSDAAYSEAFARHKWRTANWAAMRIRRSLREKGVSDRDIDVGLSTVFGEGGSIRVDAYVEDEEEDEWDEEVDLTRVRSAQLLRAARTQFNRNTRGDAQARVRRLMSWLERRGHSGPVVMDIVKVLKSELDQGYDDEDDAFRAY